MNRSLSLLRPLNRGLLAPRLVRPTVLSPAFSNLRLRAYASKTGQEGVKSGSSGTAEVPKENPHADQQNATSSAAEEVCLFFFFRQMSGETLCGQGSG
jgi:hypothetical protein